jgi:hypothetical protein
MTYVVEMAIVTNGTYTRGDGARELIRLVMYTPADNQEC